MQVSQNGWLLFVCIVLLVVTNVFLYNAILAPRVLKISVLKVGPPVGGNTVTLVHTPHSATILIDTGPDASILRLLGGALPMWQRNIDAVILTGTKSSLVGGLSDVENRYHVSTLVRVGDTTIPYGTPLTFDGSHIEILSLGTIFISYGVTSLTISSSTPAGTYSSDGNTIRIVK